MEDKRQKAMIGNLLTWRHPSAANGCHDPSLAGTYGSYRLLASASEAVAGVLRQ